jgi:ankyrin repeat protein
MRSKAILLVLLSLAVTPVVVNGQDDFARAFQRSDVETVKKMLSRDPRLLQYVDENGFTALHLAIIAESYELVQYLVEKGVPVNAEDTLGRTPLHFACRMARLDIARFLLDHKATIKPDDSGLTPLWIACQAPDTTYDREKGSVKTPILELVQLLIQRGDDPNHPIIDGRGNQTFLISAVASSGRNIPVLKLLIELGGDIDMQDGKGLTPLHQLIAHADERRGDDADLQAGLKTLIAAGADLEIPDHDGWTPLHSAAHFNHPALVRILPQAGAKAGATTPGKQTPLDFARRQKFIDIEKILLEFQKR